MYLLDLKTFMFISKSSMLHSPIDVAITMVGLNRLNWINWSQTAEITVSNAPKIDPNASVISIRKNIAEKKPDPTILVNTSGYAMKARPAPPLTT